MKLRPTMRATVALVPGLVLVLAACSPETETADDAPPPDAPEATATPTPAGTGDDDDPLAGATFRVQDWPETDFSQRNVSLADIVSGGPPRDGIPPISEPRFISVDEADEWLQDRESVQFVEIDGDARAYPVQILMWHEIVNDVVGERPIAITYCPLCNTAITFDREIPDVGVVEFGTTGTLYNSALVMYDRTTESWFWQVSGEGIVGELTGLRLQPLPSTLTSWAEFKAAHPNGRVLSRDTGHHRDYGRNPYVNYDSSTDPFLFSGPEDGRLSAMERVVTVEIEGHAVAFPFSRLVDQPVIHHTVAEQEIVVFYRKGAASPLDASAVAEGRDVGSTGVFVPVVNEEALTFEWDGEAFRDDLTGSTWTLLGEAIDGSLAGERLEPVVHGNHFWFSWAVYQPETEIVPAVEGE
jgi:hypothetical protein